MARARWGRRIEFFLTTVGYSVGVGDLWRFPYLVMKNGGGAFLIPIIIFNVIVAIPVVYLEMIMGQYGQTGAVSIWRVCPLLKGVGYGTVIATFLFSIYYGVIIAWMLLYFVYSMFKTLPWSTCDNDWNIKETCIVTTTAEKVVENVTTTVSTLVSAATTMAPTVLRNETSAEQFWKYEIHNMSDGLHDLGDINWPIVGCFAVVQIACFLILFKGIKLTGKVVYFTVIGPFVLLAVFLVRGAILPGADIGIKFYLTPDMSKLAEPKIWAEACMQVFVSVGPGFGAMITFASYNKFSNNCTRDAIFVCLADLCTGFFGGFVIFSVIGHVSHMTGVPMSEFKQSGFGLGFIAYPEAANYLPPPQLWCALFFMMSFFLGIDSQFPNFEVVMTALSDEFHFTRGRTTLLTGIIIIVVSLLALPQLTQGGIYLLTLVDWYAATFSVTIFALIEVLVMMYIYGLKRVEDNLREMTGQSVPIYFKICWLVVTPILLLVTIGFSVYTYVPPIYSGYVYPGWAVAIGWLIACSSLTPIPVYAIYKLWHSDGSLMHRIKTNLTPTEEWGPPDEIRAGETTPKAMDSIGVDETGGDEKKEQTAKDNPGFTQSTSSLTYTSQL